MDAGCSQICEAALHLEKNFMAFAQNVLVLSPAGIVEDYMEIL